MLIQTQNVSNVSEVDFTTGISTSSQSYRLMFDSAVSIGSSLNAYLTIQLSSDGGTTYQNANYINYLGGGVTSGIASALLYDGGGLVAYTASGSTELYNMTSGVGLVSSFSNANDFDILGLGQFGQIIAGVYSGTALSVNAIRVVSSDGNNISGNFYLYSYPM
jgi:hypothetical protein